MAVRGFLSGDDFLTLLSWDKSVSYLKQVGGCTFVSASAFCHKVRLLGYHRGYGLVCEWLHLLLSGRPCIALRVCVVVFSPPFLSWFCVCALCRMLDFSCRILDRSG